MKPASYITAKTKLPTISINGAAGTNSVPLKWTNPLNNNATSSASRRASSFILYRNTTNNIATARQINVAGNQSVGEITYTDTGLSENTTYYYWVKAVYGTWGSGISPQWGPIAVTTKKTQVLETFADVKCSIQSEYGSSSTKRYGVSVYFGTTKPSPEVKVRLYRSSSSTPPSSHYVELGSSKATFSPGSTFGKGYYVGPAVSGYQTLSSSSYTQFFVSVRGSNGTWSTPRWIGQAMAQHSY